MSIAVVFPGQGSQSPGMLAELAARYPAVVATFDEAREQSGIDLWALAQSGPAEALADTRITQPLMLTSGVAVWRALQAAGLSAPVAMAGHSLGEFTALVAAEALSFSAALALVQRRAELMAAAVPEGEGGMAALLGMDDETVNTLCQAVSGKRISEAVNFNAPGQVAISGHLDALQQTIDAAREQGVKRAVMLPVSVPNHCSLMQPAGHELAKTIDAIDWHMPTVPVLQNATAVAPATLDEMLVRLREHVYRPVYWTRTVQNLRDQHAITRIIEAGPGKVLAGLGKRIDRSLPVLPVDSPDTLRAALDAVGQTENKAADQAGSHS